MREVFATESLFPTLIYCTNLPMRSIFNLPFTKKAFDLPLSHHENGTKWKHELCKIILSYMGGLCKKRQHDFLGIGSCFENSTLLRRTPNTRNERLLAYSEPFGSVST